MTRLILASFLTFGSLLYGAICADNAMSNFVGLLAVCIPSEESCPDNPLYWQTVLYNGDRRVLATVPKEVLVSDSAFGLVWSPPEPYNPTAGQSIELYLEGQSPDVRVVDAPWCHSSLQ